MPEPELIARSTHLDALWIGRMDRASALAATATAQVLDTLRAFDPDRVAVIQATEVGSLEADEAYDHKRRAGGPSHGEPRRFPATSPNLPAGMVSIAFRLRGPCFAVGGGPGAVGHALGAARLLVGAGDAEVALVVVVDDVGPVASELLGAARLPLPPDGAEALIVGA
jgi:3-oxoacyl-(acyl-carrier-protein) synthase